MEPLSAVPAGRAAVVAAMTPVRIMMPNEWVRAWPDSWRRHQTRRPAPSRYTADRCWRTTVPTRLAQCGLAEGEGDRVAGAGNSEVDQGRFQPAVAELRDRVGSGEGPARQQVEGGLRAHGDDRRCRRLALAA